MALEKLWHQLHFCFKGNLSALGSAVKLQAVTVGGLCALCKVRCAIVGIWRCWGEEYMAFPPWDAFLEEMTKGMRATSFLSEAAGQQVKAVGRI